MDELMLFTDGSVNIRSKIGYGACLALTEPVLSMDSLEALVKVKRFEDTSSTKLELQTLLWALGDSEALEKKKIIIYTDSQNLIGLSGRRKRFEQNGYRSKNNRLFTNWELYRDFFCLTDQLNCELVKVTGHKASGQKEYIDRLFTLVDRASRKALRKENE